MLPIYDISIYNLPFTGITIHIYFMSSCNEDNPFLNRSNANHMNATHLAFINPMQLLPGEGASGNTFPQQWLL